ncbi:MAG: tRNA (adenosine(37)-N6)-threonylcarbamoyltransferase complex dimerization subunit type 1 TsaB [Desulfobacteraceae bacterium]|nr:MAG: tRNA (adenosine(37)-N6)-threonylcarbamoyltransferase complex dimerization subunit type 1 TsaB [Desulfobacteraceae bacterium]
MKILSVSTAENGCSLALFSDWQLVCEDFWKTKLTHSKRLAGMISTMVKERAGWDLDHIDAFVSAKGPGSFTGVRIGISTVMGFSAALSKPVIGVSSLDGIAWQFFPAPVQVTAMMDAKRSEVYTAVYRFEGGRLSFKGEEAALSPEQAVEQAGRKGVFAGSGAQAYKDLILEMTKAKGVVAPNTTSHVKAGALVDSLASDPAVFEAAGQSVTPVYLRKSDAEIHFSGLTH